MLLNMYKTSYNQWKMKKKNIIKNIIKIGNKLKCWPKRKRLNGFT